MHACMHAWSFVCMNVSVQACVLVCDHVFMHALRVCMYVCVSTCDACMYLLCGHARMRSDNSICVDACNALINAVVHHVCNM